MRVFNKSGSKKRLFEMMAIVNKTTIDEKYFTQDELNEIASLYKSKKQNENWDYNDAEREHLGQQDLEYDQNTSDEDKNFDNLKSALQTQFKPDITNNDDHQIQFSVKKPNGRIGVYKIVKFYIKNDEGIPLYGLYKYDDSFDGFDLLHDEIGSRALDADQIPVIISQDIQK